MSVLAFYIAEQDSAGQRVHVCRPGKGGCGHAWPVMSRRELDRQFEKPVPTRVMGLQGWVDTVMSPLDSIRHQKTLLHAGLMSLDPRSGEVKAWVGDLDYQWSQFDNVVQSRRQVGSTFKPFVYATAIRLGLDPCTELPNQKTCIEMPEGQDPWCPENSDLAYGEMVTLEYALANSMNTVTAKLIKDYGVERVVELAHAMGIQSEIPAVPSIALGVAQLSLEEVTSANATFAGGGVWHAPRIIRRIEDKRGNTIYEPRPEIEQGLDAATAYRVLEMMKGVVDGAYNAELGTKGTGIRLVSDGPRPPGVRWIEDSHGRQDGHHAVQRRWMVHRPDARARDGRLGGGVGSGGAVFDHDQGPRRQYGPADFRVLHEGRPRGCRSGTGGRGLPSAGRGDAGGPLSGNPRSAASISAVAERR